MDTKPSPEPLFYQKARAFLQRSILGMIIGGIITSALYDLMKGTGGVLATAILRSLTFMFHSYVEMIHQPIGDGQGDQLAKAIFIVLIGSFLVTTSLAAVAGVQRIKGDHKKAEELKYKIKKLALREESIEAMKALEEKVANVKATECKSTEVVEDLEKSLAALKEIAEGLEDPDAKTKSTSELVEESERVIRLVKRSKRFGYSSLTGFLIASIYVAVFLVGNLYTREASTFVERSIEILTPNIPPDRVLQLRAKYRSVDSAQKFYDLHDELQTIAKEKNVTLPKFTVIKR
jgi:hypothetical protein